MSLLYWDARHRTQHSSCVSPQLEGGGGPPASNCWPCSAYCSLRGRWLHRHTVLRVSSPPKGPQVLLCKAAFQLLSSQCALMQGLFLSRCKALLSFMNMNTLAAIKVPLNSSKTIWSINHSSQFCSSKFSPSEFGDYSKIRCTK